MGRLSQPRRRQYPAVVGPARGPGRPRDVFIVGWTAQRQPQLVREIVAAGHEIASHGFWHRLVYEQSPAEFREDLRLGRDVLQDILGRRVTAYRAPSFSITRRSLWAREILVEEGFDADFSVFPIRHDRYGIPRPARHPSRRHACRSAVGISTLGGAAWAGCAFRWAAAAIFVSAR